MTLEEQYKLLEVEGNRVSLPSGTMLPDYKKIRATLIKNGGKYRKNGFDFQSDPSDIIARLCGGEKVNIKKEFQFYETPEPVINLMLELANIKPTDTVLEPSAGRGAILDKLVPIAGRVIACEFMADNVNHLIGYYPEVDIQEGDYLKEEFKSEGIDKIVANPPFNKGQDIAHLEKMYYDLKPGGTLVCITSTGWMFNSQKKFQQFRDWMSFDDTEGGVKFSNIGTDKRYTRNLDASFFEEAIYIKMLDGDTFKKSGAAVRSCIIQITKQPHVEMER